MLRGDLFSERYAVQGCNLDHWHGKHTKQGSNIPGKYTIAQFQTQCEVVPCGTQDSSEAQKKPNVANYKTINGKRREEDRVNLSRKDCKNRG